MRVRRAIPLVDKDGHLSCPFCKPTHTLDPLKESPCGTVIQVTAVQTVYKAQWMREPPKCLKCGGSSGEMVRFGSAFLHLVDCKPGMALMPETPKLSRWAKMVYNLPDFAKRPLERRLGRASPLELIDEKGVKTGEIAGYFFYHPVSQRGEGVQYVNAS